MYPLTLRVPEVDLVRITSDPTGLKNFRKKGTAGTGDRGLIETDCPGV